MTKTKKKDLELVHAGMTVVDVYFTLLPSCKDYSPGVDARLGEPPIGVAATIKCKE